MKKKKKKASNYTSIIAIIIIIIFCVIILKQANKASRSVEIPTLTGSNSMGQANIHSNSKIITYYSKFLKFYIDISQEYSIKDLNDAITLKNNNGNGEILISRNGTNYNSLDEYFSNADTNQRLRSKINKTRIIINGSPVYKIDTEYLDYPELNYRGYYFYKEYAVYNLQTKSAELYSDLDQIARSFRYAP